MGAGFTGKVVAVAVDDRKNTDAAFNAAMAEVGPEDRLVIIFARPLRHGDDHYNFVTKPVQSRFDKMSEQLLGKYSALATAAKVNFEAVEVEGNHLREAILKECYLLAADQLFEARRTLWESLVKDKNGYNFCSLCNPYFRPGGRFAGHRPCHLAHTEDPPCPVVEVSASSSSRGR